MKKLFHNLIIKWFKCWGVRFDSDLPPEFIITVHAEERMDERFRCNKDKVKKIIIKAWHSKDKVKKQWLNNRKYFGLVRGATYKYFMGYIFVFKVYHHEGYTQKKLITMYKK